MSSAAQKGVLTEGEGRREGRKFRVYNRIQRALTDYNYHFIMNFLNRNKAKRLFES